VRGGVKSLLAGTGAVRMRQRGGLMPDVVDLIMQDHRQVEELFEKLKSHPEQRAGLVPVLTTLLTAHSRAEEAEVYPAAAQAGGEEEVEHSQEEHVEADQLLARLAQTDPASAEFESVLDELVDAVTHHVEEEESTVLPGMRERLSEDRRTQLGDAFLASRAEHLGEQPEDITKEQLEQQAANMDVAGTSDMSKQELAEELRRSASG
jgi:hemerythrin superfamily protein